MHCLLIVCFLLRRIQRVLFVEWVKTFDFDTMSDPLNESATSGKAVFELASKCVTKLVVTER